MENLRVNTSLSFNEQVFIPTTKKSMKTITKVIDGVEWHREVEVEEPAAKDVTVSKINVQFHAKGDADISYTFSDGVVRNSGDVFYTEGTAKRKAERDIKLRSSGL